MMNQGRSEAVWEKVEAGGGVCGDEERDPGAKPRSEVLPQEPRQASLEEEQEGRR